MTQNSGWVSVGCDHDTAAFAVASTRRWWQWMGQRCHPNATELLITADAGGSNEVRTRLWKTELQEFSDDTELAVSVCHFPPGTSKWNKIEHRMSCHITENWRERPLVSYAAIVHLIASTTTRQGLCIQAQLNSHTYPHWVKISNKQMKSINIKCDKFHETWNYTISPRPK